MASDRQMLRNLPLIQLRAFALLAELGSYTRVAKELSYTEPAVNMQVKGLERTAGIQLVHRESNRVVLTNAGMRILPTVMEILERTIALESLLRQLQPGRRVVVGAGRLSGVFVLMPLLAQYREATGTEVELHILPPADLAAGLLNGELDVVLCGDMGPVLPTTERIRHQITRATFGRRPDRWALACPPSFRRSPMSKRAATVKTIFAPPWALTRLGELSHACREILPDAELVTLETAEAVRSAVATGLGAGLLATGSGEMSGLDIVAVIDNTTLVTIHLIHKRSRMLSPSSRQLVAFLVGQHRRQRWLDSEPLKFPGPSHRPVARLIAGRTPQPALSSRPRGR